MNELPEIYGERSVDQFSCSIESKGKICRRLWVSVGADGEAYERLD